MWSNSQESEQGVELKLLKNILKQCENRVYVYILYGKINPKKIILKTKIFFKHN